VKLTSYTDYALRTLMYLADSGDRLVTIRDIADAQGIAKNHLTKVVHHLGMLGIVETTRGRNGGLRLGRKAEDINIGDVVRHTEQDFAVAECFEKDNLSCRYSSSCKLKGALARATAAFLGVLDDVNLATLTACDRRTDKCASPAATLLHFKSTKARRSA